MRLCLSVCLVFESLCVHMLPIALETTASLFALNNLCFFPEIVSSVDVLIAVPEKPVTDGQTKYGED